VHSYIIIIFILDIINDNNYCIDDQKEKSTENATTLIIQSYNEYEEKQSTSNSNYKTIFFLESQNNVLIGFEGLSSDDEEIDDTDKDKDYTPPILECNEDINESLEDFPIDLVLFLNEENIFNDDDNVDLAVDNPPV